MKKKASEQKKQGIYAYAFSRIKNVDKNSLPTRGVAFAGKVEKAAYKDITVYFSRVDDKTYSKKAIESRLKKDMEWAKKNVLGHHKIIEKVRIQKNEVIPVKFGVMYASETSLMKFIETNYEKLSALFDELKGKDEWDVKAYVVIPSIAEDLVKKDPDLKMRLEQANSASEGLKWYMAKKNQEIIKEKTDQAILQGINKIIRNIEHDCEKIATIPGLVEQKKDEEMVWHGAALVPREKEIVFLEKVNAIKKMKGWKLALSGPWPPYNFVGDLNNDSKSL